MGKGVMFSITMVLVSSLLLVISAIMLNNSNAAELRSMEFGIASSINDISGSIEKSISDIFSDSGLSVSGSGNAVNISESLPSSNLSSVNESLNDFKSFVESESGNVAINIDSLDIIVLPSSIRYVQNSSLTRLINNFNESKDAVFTFNMNNNSVGSINWLSFSSGSNSLTIVYKNSSTIVVSSKLVDFNKDLSIDLKSGSREDFAIEKDSDDLVIKYKNNAGAVNLGASITLNNNILANAAMGSYVIIDHSAVGVSKIFYPRIV